MRQLYAVLAALVAAVALTVGYAPPAQADNSAISHRTDEGYDPSIIIECDSGRIEYLYEGQASWWDSKCPGGVHSVHLRAHDVLVCMWWDEYGWNWRTIAKEPGEKPIGTYFAEHSAGCVLKYHD